MYHLAPFYDSSAPIDLPKSMYKQESFPKPVIGASGNTAVNGPLMVNGGPITIEELERRQDAILERLRALKIEVDKLLAKQLPTAADVKSCSTAAVAATCSSSSKSAEALAGGKAALKKAGLSCSSLVDLTLWADPAAPPLSIFVLYSKLCDKFSVLSASHLHSSVADDVARHVRDRVSRAFNHDGHLESDRSKYQLGFTVVWKEGTAPTLVVRSANSTPVVGEGNVARYLARLLGYYDDHTDIVMATRIDDLIDLAEQLIQAKGNTAQEITLLAELSKSKVGANNWLLGGTSASLADVVVWSAVKQIRVANNRLAPSLVTWMQHCASLPEFSLAIQLI